MRVRVTLRSIVCSVFVLHLMAGMASATSAGLDTPPGVPTLPIAVEGQTALTLNADTSGAVPPQPTVNFTGPFNEGGATGTTITTTGQVGIGTSNPQAALDVNGNVNFGPAHSINTRAVGTINSLSSQDNAALSLVNDANSAWTIWNADGTNVSHNNLEFLYGPGSNPVVAMTMFSNGNVGIGTTAPQATLDVNGTIKAGTIDIGLQLLTNTVNENANGTLTTADAYCPNGKKVIGGGCNNDGQGGWCTWDEGYPLSDLSGYQCSCAWQNANNGIQDTLTAYAICANVK